MLNRVPVGEFIMLPKILIEVQQYNQGHPINGAKFLELDGDGTKSLPEPMLTYHQHDPLALHWRHNDHDGVSNHQPHGCLLNRLFRRRSKKTSKLRVTGLCVGNSPVTGEFPAQMASNAENASIWRRYQGILLLFWCPMHYLGRTRIRVKAICLQMPWLLAAPEHQ